MDVLDYKEKELRYYVFGNIAIMIASSKIFQAFIKDVGQDDMIISLLKLLTGVSVFGAILYVYTFLISSLFTGETKISIAYLKIGKPAGFTVFSDMRNDPKDMRILKDAVLQKYKSIYDQFPDDSSERRRYENSKWYDIYHKYRDLDIIKSANREFLAFRDMSIMTIPITTGYLVATLLGYVNFSWLLIVFFIAELIATNIAMRKKCERLVKNVIAIDLRE